MTILTPLIAQRADPFQSGRTRLINNRHYSLDVRQSRQMIQAGQVEQGHGSGRR